MSSYFITGTDTSVGKTHVVCALLRDLCRRGISSVGYVPVSCGSRADARAIREACASKLSLEKLNPLYFRASAAPSVAAEFERRRVEPRVLTAGFHALAERYETVLVEAMGGWLLPLDKGCKMADLAEQLQLPVLVVANNRFGAESHVMLTIQDIQRRGLVCRGIILNHIAEDWDTASLTNRRVMEEYTGVPVIAELIHGQDELDSSILDEVSA